LTHRHVRFTTTTQGHVDRENAWWLANRDHVEVFAEELEQALQIIALVPANNSVPVATIDLAGFRG